MIAGNAIATFATATQGGTFVPAQPPIDLPAEGLEFTLPERRFEFALPQREFHFTLVADND